MQCIVQTTSLQATTGCLQKSLKKVEMLWLHGCETLSVLHGSKAESQMTGEKLSFAQFLRTRDTELNVEITEVTTSTEVYERVLERRLRCLVEDWLGEWQHGFRPNRSTTDLIFSMKMILEKTWELSDITCLAFLNLEKAFDRVPRSKLWKAMQKAEYDIP